MNEILKLDDIIACLTPEFCLIEGLDVQVTANRLVIRDANRKPNIGRLFRAEQHGGHLDIKWVPVYKFVDEAAAKDTTMLANPKTFLAWLLHQKQIIQRNA